MLYLLKWLWLKIKIILGLFPIIQSNLKSIYPKFMFKVFKVDKNSKARRGVIYTPHGKVQTPAFIFCATKASMRSTTISYLLDNNTQIILSNAYHLYLKGHETIKRLGGLHKALGFNKPMLTDSGGYQVFAMNFSSVSKDIKGARNKTYSPTLIKIIEDYAEFHSYYDRSKIKLGPEKSMEIQINLGADLVMSMDECTSSTINKEETRKSMELSHRWEKRSLDYFLKHKDEQALYGIIQGGVYQDLRKESIDFVNQNKFFGIAVGGCLGSTTKEMYQTVNYTMNLVRKDRPVHLLGIGYIKDIFNGVKQGIDTFDCVHPTRVSRHNMVYIPFYLCNNDREKRTNCLDLSKTKFKNDDTPINPMCKCSTCKKYKKSYLHLLIKSNENVVNILLTNHNIFFFNQLMENIRNGIEEEKLNEIEKIYLG